MIQHSGADWVEAQLSGNPKYGPMSDFGRKVADILGNLTRGIYHISHQCVRPDWTDPDIITVILYNSAHNASYDGQFLTELVFFCHLLHVRVQIEGAGPRYLRLVFSRREPTGDIYHRHPGLKEAIEKFNAYFEVDLLAGETEVAHETPNRK